VRNLIAQPAKARRLLIFLTSLLLLVFMSAIFTSPKKASAAGPLEGADMIVIKSGPDTADPGSNISYTITVINGGPDDATDATLNDPLPGATTFVSISSPANWQCTTPNVGAGGSVSCTNPSFPAGSNVEFILTVNVDPGATPGTFITNTATVSSSTLDENDENNSSTTSSQVTGGSDVQVSKTTPNEFAVADTDVTYTITVTNNGPDTATGVSFTDSLSNGSPPSPMTFVSFTFPPGWSCGVPSTTTTCSIASLPANSPQVFTFKAHIPSGTPPGTVYTNTVNESSSSPDPNSENNTVSVTTTVVDNADLTVSKTHTGTFTQDDKGRTYQITVSNVSPFPSQGLVTLSDSLPAGLIARSFSGDGWTCGSIPANGTPGPATLTCTRSDSVTNGAYQDLILTVDVSCSAPANVTNTATVSGGGDASPGNNTSNDKTTINPETTPPTIVCPGSISKFAEAGQKGAHVNAGTPVASDNCNPVTVKGVRNDGQPLDALYPIGVTVITWTAKDAKGNTASCTQSIIVLNPSSNQRRLPPLE